MFGGDGATACLPLTAHAEAEAALAAALQLASEEFALELRVGLVPMAVIRLVLG